MSIAKSLAETPIPSGLDADRVRAEIARRIVRATAETAAEGGQPTVADMLTEALTVLSPVTNGLTGAEAAYATQYVKDMALRMVLHKLSGRH